jgi:hypothetical protein
MDRCGPLAKERTLEVLKAEIGKSVLIIIVHSRESTQIVGVFSGKTTPSVRLR